MSVLSHSRVIHGIVVPAARMQPDQFRGESRWKLHLRQIADSSVRERAQGMRRAVGAALNTPLGR